MKNTLKFRMSAVSFQRSVFIKFILFSLFAIHCSLFASNGSDTTKAKTYSLKEAQDFALQNNYSTVNARTDIEKSKKLVQQTTAIGLPQINASVSYQNFIDIPTQLIPGEFFGQPGSFIPIKFGTNYNGSGSITASQLLFDGSYVVGLQAASAYLDMSKKVLEKSTIEVRESVAQAYYLVLVAEENKKILDSTLILTNKALNDTKEFQKNGFVEETDVDQLQLLVTNLENKLNMVNRQVEIAYNLLKFQMGIDISEQIVLSDKLNEILNMALGQNLYSQDFDYNRHIDYRSMVSMKKLDELLLKKDRFAYLPSMNCFITTARNAYRSDFNFFKSNEQWFRTTIFGVNLSLPIWSSGIKHYKIEQDRLELKKHKVEMTQVEQGLKLSVQNNKAQVKTYSDQYLNEIKNIELAKKIYNKTIYKYQQGVSSSLDLTQVQNQYLTTQGNYFNVILQLLNANSNLNKSLGN